MKTIHCIRGALAALVFVIVQVAQAHAFPKVQQPAAGATLTTAPHAVSIEFDEALEPAFSSITVADSQGKSVAEGKSAVDAGNHKLMKVALSPLASGTYVVTWVAVANDGHRTQGHYAFTVK
ncbi:Copper resistance protein CopC [Paraburkholderia ribeironis]|uniref:Copper resistance protein CopC n=1 Tax=Paraburkholderia ribeironis TaxID=1247936 RepID=A0A1N7RX84_9BURK|nr:copper resistance protein CopC [Paraburkholderia ribeironis]SIT39644.1 Copper resistance protein CopC [Paraburkholderia ribeironis]